MFYTNERSIVVSNDYNVFMFQECPRCRDHEPDHAFVNCSFSVEKRNDKKVQVFECTRCKHNWEQSYE